MSFEITPDEQRAWLTRWAAQYGCELKETEVGFGRECIAIVAASNGHHVGFAEGAITGGHCAPERYHKDDFLAVLLYGGDLDERLGQLFEWCRYLDAKGATITTGANPYRDIPGVASLPRELADAMYPASVPMVTVPDLAAIAASRA